MTMNSNNPLGASFRDPSGFLFTHNGELYRQVNQSYATEYNRLMESGLYDKLIKARILVPHAEVEIPAPDPSIGFKIIQPERIPFISYPYEWAFSQLKDAALATLSLQKRALKSEMSLKDASAYNIQFQNGKPLLIDTLSFEIYQEGQPWVAYRQFCQHFLAPLSLMAYVDIRLGQLLRVYIDGVPLDLASELLPTRTRFNFGLLTHIHLHASAQRRYAGAAVKQPAAGKGMSKQSMVGLIESLESTIKKLNWIPAGTEWGNYYEITNYSDAAFEHKKGLVSKWLDQANPRSVWDLGANTGVFSRLASGCGISTISFDIDPAAVEQNYRQVRSAKEQNILPLLIDLTNPSPAIGWHNRERESLSDRAPAEMVLALALIHHLAISNNVPFHQLADFFHDMAQWLIIEFVPKSDSQVQRLLASRVDIFDHYTRDEFEEIFRHRFDVLEAVQVRESERFIYLMRRK